jgi:hypothetical protein
MRYETLFKIDSTVTEFDTTYNEEIYQKLSADSAEFVPDIPSPQNAFTGNSALAGRENIMMTEWGPYDFRSPSFGM